MYPTMCIVPLHRISEKPPRETAHPWHTAQNPGCGAAQVCGGPISIYRHFVVSLMITGRAGQPTSHAPAQLFQPCCPGRSYRRLQAVNFWNSRDGGGGNQRISRGASPRCVWVAWRAAQCGELKTAASAALDRLLLPVQLSKAVRATAAPPFAQASMSALPSSFSLWCSCARAGISSMAQLSYTMAPRWLRGDLHVYVARELQIAGVGGPQ